MGPRYAWPVSDLRFSGELMRHTRSAFAILALLMSTRVDAQNIPDAGALMRQIEQNSQQSQRQQAAQKRESLPPAMVLGEDTLLTVQRFQFKGNKRLTSEQLQAVAAPFLNRPLNPQALQHLTHAVSEAYRQNGWVVQAYIPRQDLKNGDLTVQVIESIPPNQPSR